MKNNFSKITAISFSVWKESVRNKGLFTLIFVFLLILLSSHIISAAASINSDRILQTMGLFVFGMFGILTNIYLGTSLIQEISEKRLYIILVRPISRTSLLLGKFSGTCLVLLSVFFAASGVWLFILYINQVPITLLHFLTLFFLLGEWIILASASLFFAVFTTPLLHGLFLFAFAFFGHYSKDLILYSTAHSNIFIKKTLLCLYYFIPNLELINFKGAMLYNEAISLGNIASGFLLVVLWTLILFTGSGIVFSKIKLL